MGSTGRCACGDIRFEITASPLAAGQCFCRDCQYASGGGPANAFVVKKDALRIISGEVRSFEVSLAEGRRSVRQFCQRCGTPLFGWKSRAPQIVAVMAGAMDDPTVFKPMSVGWTSSAPPWAHLDPSLRKFPRNADE